MNVDTYVFYSYFGVFLGLVLELTGVLPVFGVIPAFPLALTGVYDPFAFNVVLLAPTTEPLAPTAVLFAVVKVLEEADDANDVLDAVPDVVAFTTGLVTYVLVVFDVVVEGVLLVVLFVVLMVAVTLVFLGDYIFLEDSN